MSSPCLWTKFECADVPRTLQYLTRSKPVPIDVTVDFDSDPQALSALKSATDRFGSLTLRLQAFELLRAFRQLESPARALEHLEVHAMPHLGDGPGFRPSISETFFGGSTPSLKSLYLSGINTKLNFSKFPALTHLTLVTSVRIFNMSELFQVFTSARLLEEVSVEFNGPTSPIPEGQVVIQLPRMRRLSFSNTVEEFPKHLLSSLVTPSVEEVRLDISLPGEDTRTLQDFLPPQLQNFPHLSKVDNLKLDVPHAHCNIQFGGPGGVISIHAFRGGNRGQKDNFQSHWLESLEPMSVTDVKDLTLRGYYPEIPLGQCPVFKTLKTMDAIQSLVVERCDNAIVINTLFPAEKEVALFPRLESLAFQLISEPTTIFPSLTDMARARSRLGLPLDKVSSDEYTTFRRSDVDSLRRHVRVVKLNTRANSPHSEPVSTYSYHAVTVRILFVWGLPVGSLLISFFKVNPLLPNKPGGQIPVHSPTGGSPNGSKGSRNPLADLAAMYSRG